MLARLKGEGVGIIYVSHRMAEIRRIADRVTILRDGRRVATVAAADATDTSLVELMTGRRIDMLFPTIVARPAARVLEIEGLTLADGSVRDALALCPRRGNHRHRGPRGFRQVGADPRGLWPGPDRRGQPPPAWQAARQPPLPPLRSAGASATFPPTVAPRASPSSAQVRENASMAALDLARLSRFGLLRRAAERGLVRGVMERLSLRPLETERRVRAFSGGNRQKVLLARGLMRDIGLFLFDEPTVGIDVGAKLEVYALMKDLAEAGAAIVLVSSELPEVMHLSNRLYVMHRSHVVAELAGEAMTEHAVLGHFFSEAA